MYVVPSACRRLVPETSAFSAGFFIRARTLNVKPFALRMSAFDSPAGGGVSPLPGPGRSSDFTVVAGVGAAVVTGGTTVLGSGFDPDEV
jgi:hypothetical protein